MDILGLLMANLPWTIVAGIGAGFLRNIAGWLENALKDGKIDDYEKKQLLGTIVKYVSFITLLSFGLGPGESIIAAFGIDVGQSVVKKVTK